jgi:hypothetical protein
MVQRAALTVKPRWRARARTAQDVPGGERPDEGGVGRRAGDQELVEPRLDPVQVLLALGQQPGVDQQPRR